MFIHLTTNYTYAIVPTYESKRNSQMSLYCCGRVHTTQQMVCTHKKLTYFIQLAPSYYCTLVIDEYCVSTHLYTIFTGCSTPF